MATTLLASGNSTTATTTINFSSQAADTLLILTMSADDYRTTSGSNRPESSGFALVSPGGLQEDFLGHYMWWKRAAGGETSVSYTIGSASPSCYVLSATTGVDWSGTALDISNGNNDRTATDAKTTPTVTTTSGPRIAFASLGASSSAGVFTGYTSWINSFTEIGDANTANASGTRDTVGLGYLEFSGGGSVTGGASSTGPGPQCRTSVIAVFKMSGGGGGTTYTPSPADNVGITDSLTDVVSAVRTPADPVGITDSVTANLVGSGSVNPADNVGVTDAVTVAVTYNRTVSDSVGIIDTGSQQAIDFGISIDDPVGVTDSAAVVSALVRTISDAVGITDSATASAAGAGSATPADSLGITDQAATTVLAARAASDPIGLTDAVVLQVAKTIADQVGVTDAVTANLVASGNASPNDGVGITDSVTVTRSFVVQISDSIGISDQPDRIVATVRAVTDGVGVSDSVIKLVGIPPNVIFTVRERSSALTLTEHASTLTIRERG